MQFAIAQAGDTLEKLSRRIYCACSDEERKAATQLIAAANPNLAQTSTLSAGSIVIVPAAAGLALTDEVKSGSGIAMTLIQSLRQELLGTEKNGLENALAKPLEQQEHEARATLGLAKSREVRNLAKTEKLVEERLGSITKAAEEKRARVNAMRALNRQAVEELNADLDGLLGLLDTPRRDVAG